MTTALKTASRTSVLATVGLTLLAAPPAPKPKLVVAIIIDQFRYDYLTRFQAEYHGGLAQLMNSGADFTNAFYDQAPTITAVGHSIFMSGAMPAVSGIAGNAWYDRGERKIVTSVCDWNERVVGSTQPPQQSACTDADPASPRRLLASTVGDELRNANADAKVIGISLKARAAILPSGHRANAAYWFEGGSFVTSTFYRNELPEWAGAFNSQHLAEAYLKRPWPEFPNWQANGNIAVTPWGNELVERFAEAAITGEKLGQRGVTDLLTVSFSSNDYVGHRVGPAAPEVHNMALRTDEVLGKLFRALDTAVGLKNVVIVLSADHGVADTVAVAQRNKMPTASIDPAELERTVEAALEARFGAGPWIVPGGGEAELYFTHPERAREMAPVAEQTLMNTRAFHVARVYTREQLENGIAGDFVARAIQNGFNAERSGDLFLVFEPGVLWGSATGAGHFSPWNYDRHVPVLFMGPGIKPGHYNATITPNDVAPTLATMLQIQTPSGSSGRVLTEMLQ